MKTTLLQSFAGASLLALILVTPGTAVPINGSISFYGAPNFDNPSLSGATEVTSYDSAYLAAGQQTGDYALLPDLLPVTFSPFVFSPPDQTVSPLWTFEYNGLTYSAWITSMVSSFNAGLNIWNFGGSGFLSITGYEDTAAQWNFSTGQVGDSYFFGSAAASIGPSSVPESGGTMPMFILGLASVLFAGRGRLIRAGKRTRQRLLPQWLG
jgi:hypothetical protein